MLVITIDKGIIKTSFHKKLSDIDSCGIICVIIFTKELDKLNCGCEYFFNKIKEHWSSTIGDTCENFVVIYDGVRI